MNMLNGEHEWGECVRQYERLTPRSSNKENDSGVNLYHRLKSPTHISADSRYY